MNDLSSGIESLQLSSRSVEETKIIRKNHAFLRDVLLFAPEFGSWKNQTFDKPFHLVLGKFPSVNERFDGTMRLRNYTVQNVVRVENPFLLAQYYLKKIQIEKRNATVGEKKYFHGTKGHNVVPICLNNFNWRKVVTGKFGHGISFSPRSDYSRHSCSFMFNLEKSEIKKYLFAYDNEISDYYYAMFYVKVLQGNEHYGSHHTFVPNPGYDTTTNGKGTVYVKYEDAEFYPEYIVLMT
ncbi:unnamed protein product [Brassicogethes aeneus]|uniref:Poly [ADP-ribose] polymerase n=1 Tax=Brassicogethes aeneus TaxID=1431903 RepID=A0A9P0BCP7_BRAAE|nr:unnamed protein product [Brassicogethes aeneus]